MQSMAEQTDQKKHSPGQVQARIVITLAPGGRQRIVFFSLSDNLKKHGM